MKDLFYFPLENLLCWVAGYTWDGNTSSVSEMIESLKKNAEKFAATAKVDFAEVRTDYIYQSRRYKNMRVFYSKVSAENVPAEAYEIKNPEWTMSKWLSD